MPKALKNPPTEPRPTGVTFGLSLDCAERSEILQSRLDPHTVGQVAVAKLNIHLQIDRLARIGHLRIKGAADAMQPLVSHLPKPICQFPLSNVRSRDRQPQATRTFINRCPRTLAQVIHGSIDAAATIAVEERVGRVTLDVMPLPGVVWRAVPIVASVGVGPDLPQ